MFWDALYHSVIFRFDIEQQNEIISNLETELKQTNTHEDLNNDKRSQLELQQRQNYLNLKHMKRELKSFLDDTAKLDSDYHEDQGSAFGHLLQTLWKNFNDNGPQEYVSIEGLSFDVETKVLDHLINAEIVVRNKNNSDLIKMVDFTMSN